jgi:hypothetical protein
MARTIARRPVNIPITASLLVLLLKPMTLNVIPIILKLTLVHKITGDPKIPTNIKRPMKDKIYPTTVTVCFRSSFFFKTS